MHYLGEGTMDLERWVSQMRKGSLELVLMALLMNEGEKYGLEIVACLKDKFGLAVVEGTLYPIMNRLQEDGLVVARWSLNNPGHPRKFFNITKKGRDAVEKMHAELNTYMAKLNRVIAGDAPKLRACKKA